MNWRIICVNINDDDTLSSLDGVFESKMPGKLLRGEQILERYHRRYNNIINFKKNSRFPLLIEKAVTPKNFQYSNGIAKYKDIIYNQAANSSLLHIAGMLTHINIWNMEEDTMILEDDVILDEELFKRINIIIEDFKTINNKNKLLYFQAQQPWLEPKPLVIEKKITQYIGTLHHIPHCVAGSSAYFITKECKEIVKKYTQTLKGCDSYLHGLWQAGIIQYYVPRYVNCLINLIEEYK